MTPVARSRSLIPQGHDPPWIDSAILVYGPRKAGTTLFQNLLDGGEELFAYPAELKLKYFARKLWPTTTAAKYFKHSRIPQIESNHLAVGRYEELWGRAVARGGRWPVHDLVRFDVSCVAQSTDRMPGSVSTWCAKEVGGGRRDILAYWRRLFGPGMALFIVRDPHAVVRAVLNDRGRDGRRLSAREIVKQVLDVLRTLRRQMRYLDDPQVHFTIYEDIVADPGREMFKVADFLGIERSPVLTRPTLFGEPVVVSTASRKTTEVFRDAASWRDGLTAREQRIVEVAMRAARHVPWLAVDYEQLKARIAARHASG